MVKSVTPEGRIKTNPVNQRCQRFRLPERVVPTGGRADWGSAGRESLVDEITASAYASGLQQSR